VTVGAQEAIRALLHRYARACDDHDPAAVTACFTPDGTFTSSAGTFAGHEQIAAFYASALTGSGPMAPPAESLHQMSNVDVTLVTPTTAHTSLDALVHRWSPHDHTLTIRALRYEDEVHELGTNWLLHHRTHTLRWHTTVPTYR